MIAMETETSLFEFNGLDMRQGFTKIPESFMEYWVPKMDIDEVKVMLAIFRKTLGWHKDTDAISISQQNHAEPAFSCR